MKKLIKSLLIPVLIVASGSMWGALIYGPPTREETEVQARQANVDLNRQTERAEAQRRADARFKRNERLDCLCKFALGAVVVPILVQKILSSSLKE